MEFDKHQIESLIIADLRGGITREEKTLLEQLMLENSEVAALYQRIEQTLNSPDALRALENAATINPRDLITSTSRRMYLGRILRITVGSAAAAVLIVGAYKVLTKIKSVDKATIYTIAKNTQLVLGNGQVITLESNDTSINVNQMSLTSAQNTLSYTSTPSNKMQKGILIVPAGKFYNIVLSDGTRVMLNSESRLEFPFAFNGNMREVRIQGEAYFEVAAKAKQPFIAHMPNSTVCVLGTEFNVNCYDKQEIVSLVSGSVRTVLKRDSITLKPGEESLLSHGEAIRIRKFNATSTLAWKKGIYMFDHVTLSEVAKVISRWYGVKMEVSDKYKNVIFFGVVDRSQPVEVFMERIAEIKEGISYTLDNNTISVR